MAGKEVQELTDSNFDAEVINSNVPVLVDFWAEWCQPCIKLGPTIDQLATEYAGKVKVGKVDIDANQAVAMKYGITAIPTVMLFKGGKKEQSLVGFKTKQELVKAIEQVV